MHMKLLIKIFFKFFLLCITFSKISFKKMQNSVYYMHKVEKNFYLRACQVKILLTKIFLSLARLEKFLNLSFREEVPHYASCKKRKKESS